MPAGKAPPTAPPVPALMGAGPSLGLHQTTVKKKDWLSNEPKRDPFSGEIVINADQIKQEVLELYMMYRPDQVPALQVLMEKHRGARPLARDGAAPFAAGRGTHGVRIGAMG
eukprot:gene27183-49078_t